MNCLSALRNKPILGLLGVLALAAANAAEGDARAFALAASCAACHGPDGKSPGIIPPLEGKSAAFIAMALREYQSGSSAATVMGRLARGYSDEEITLIARYFASLTGETLP